MLNRLSFKAQIRLFSVILIVLTVASITVNYWYQIANYTEKQIEHQMYFAENVLQQNLLAQERILTTSATVLAADFGFKQAVATRDNKTIQSALDNHGKRINADLMMLLDLQGHLITVSNIEKFSESGIEQSIKDIPFKNVSAHILSIDQKVLQVIVVPVKTPRTIAYAVIGFEFDRSALRQLRDLLSLEITLVEHDKVIESSFDDPALLVKTFTKANITTASGFETNKQSLLVSSADYYSQSVAFGNSTQIFAVLSASLVTIHRDFNRLVYSILLVGLIAIVIAMVSASLLSQRVSRPLNILMRLTTKISRGYLQVPKLENYLPIEFYKLYQGFSEMSVAIEQREQEITYQAQRDILTGLYNGNTALTKLAAFLTTNSQIVVIAITIKDFRSLIDTIGNKYSDAILIELALRINSFIKNQSTPALKHSLAARIDSDDFLVALPITHTDNIAICIKALHEEIGRPYQVGDLNIRLSIYFGISNSIEHKANAERMLRRTTLALASGVKENQIIRYYQQGEDEKYLFKLRLIDELKEALSKENCPLFFHYQPKLNIITGKIDKLEALIRWKNDDDVFINPELFIDLAEKSGLIVTLTRWVILSVLEQISIWNTLGYSFKVSINLSAQDIEAKEFINYLVSTASNFNVSPSQVTLELTERDLAKNDTLVFKRLSQLKELGFDISVDDYGIGQSSLAKLKNLPVDELKIDKCFILKLNESPKDQQIVESTISLGHKLGLRVVAEGVENAESLALLKTFQCDYAQGYYLSRPLHPDTLIEWYKKQ